jgi:hypothetical protein
VGRRVGMWHVEPRRLMIDDGCLDGDDDCCIVILLFVFVVFSI